MNWLQRTYLRLTIGLERSGHPMSRKMIVETLSIAQSRLADSPLDRHRVKADIDRLQYLISLIEKPTTPSRPIT